jgi:hypothetical protein
MLWPYPELFDDPAMGLSLLDLPAFKLRPGTVGLASVRT